jgi:hypothetical protein
MFFNESIGEFWYQLNLIGEPSPPVDLPIMEAEIGKSTGHSINIDNPSNEEIHLEVSNSNPTNFRSVKIIPVGTKCNIAESYFKISL